MEGTHYLISLVSQEKFQEAIKYIQDQEKPIHMEIPAGFFNSYSVQQYSIVYLHLLYNQTVFSKSLDDLLVVDAFLKTFNPEHVLPLMARLEDIVLMFINSLKDRKAPEKALPAIKTAIERLDSYAPGIFTPLHLHFTRYCLTTRMYKISLSIIKKFPSRFINESGYYVKDLLIYFYNCALLFAGVKDFKSATHILCLAMAFRKNVRHEVVNEIKKKLLLLCAAQDVKVDRILPRYSTGMDGFGQNNMEVYFDLVKVKTLREFDEFLTKNTVILNEDGNFGLAKQIRLLYHIKELKHLSHLFTGYPTKVLDDEVLLLKDDKLVEKTLTAIFVRERSGKFDQRNQGIVFEHPNPLGTNKSHVLDVLQNYYDLLVNLFNLYDEEHENIIKERLANPNTLFA